MEHRLAVNDEDAAIVQALEILGLKQNGIIQDAFVEHFRVFVEAQRIYMTRYKKYQDRPIRSMGWRGCLMQARTCAERLWALMQDGEWVLDDALDGINYFVHYIRQGVNENRGWEYPSTEELDPG